MLKRLLLVPSLLALSLSPASAVSILFDYTYDTHGFFTPERRHTLDAAGTWLGSHLADSLTAIAPGGVNTWSQTFDHPSTGTRLSLENPTVPADALVIYVGASNLGGQTLGIGGPGGYSARGSGAWLQTVDLRGQIGGSATPPVDFGPWGGSITFDLSTSWYADPDTTTTEPFTGFDLYSVALHEIAHVLGFGTSISFNAQIDFDHVTFAGAFASGIYGSPPPLNDEAHWAAGTSSFVFGTPIAQTTAMDPSISPGVRKHMTELDMAGLRDLGWTVVPEPSAAGMLALGIGGLFLRRRRSGTSLS